MNRGCTALLALCVALPARADPLAEGEALAKAGRFEEAIARFKQADAARPGALPLCYIALAYRRVERWGQAQLFFDRCAERSRAGEPLPAWAAKLRRDVEAGAARGRGARVTIVVEPPEAQAHVSTSAYAADEQFRPRTIFLPAGEHHRTVEGPGFVAQTKVLTIGGDQEARFVLEPVRPPAVEQEPEPAPAPEPEKSPPLPAPTPAPPPSRGVWPWITIGTGAGLIAAGAVFHAMALGTKSDAEESAAAYDRLIGRFHRERALAITGYAAGAAVAGIGVSLLLRSPAGEGQPQIGWTPGTGTGTFWVGWWR